MSSFSGVPVVEHGVGLLGAVIGSEDRSENSDLRQSDA